MRLEWQHLFGGCAAAWDFPSWNSSGGGSGSLTHPDHPGKFLPSHTPAFSSSTRGGGTSCGRLRTCSWRRLQSQRPGETHLCPSPWSSPRHPAPAKIWLVPVVCPGDHGCWGRFCWCPHVVVRRCSNKGHFISSPPLLRCRLGYPVTHPPQRVDLLLSDRRRSTPPPPRVTPHLNLPQWCLFYPSIFISSQIIRLSRYQVPAWLASPS